VGWGKGNISFGGAFRKAKYEKLRRRKKKRRKRGRAKIPFPPHQYEKINNRRKRLDFRIRSPDFRQKKFGFCPKGAANFQIATFGWLLPRPKS